MFIIFSPAEIWTMIACVAIPVIVWGIQPVEYTTERRLTILVPLFRSKTYYQKPTLFGVIPIGAARVVRSDLSIGPNVQDAYTLYQFFKTFRAAIPFHGATKALCK